MELFINGRLMTLARWPNAGHVTYTLGRSLAVSVQGGFSVRIEQCEMTCFTDGAIRLSGSNHAVVASHLHQIGNIAIRLSGGDMRTLTPACVFLWHQSHPAKLAQWVVDHGQCTPSGGIVKDRGVGDLHRTGTVAMGHPERKAGHWGRLYAITPCNGLGCRISR